MNPNHMDNLVTPPPKRGPGRPPNPLSTLANAHARRIAKAQATLVADTMASKGINAITQEMGMFPRLPLKGDAPDRTPTEAKDAAFKLLNRMLWTLEKQCELAGVNSDDEARVLKLLAGLNAALPKAAEAKPLSEMTDEEIKAQAGIK